HAVADFALFLDNWRNGEESFYEALDRAAGTPEEVFFYDAMIGDFVSKFGATGAIAKDLAAGHNALHTSFLAYRQYRAFREAAALSILLPPDVPLPSNLRRYEEAPEGALSMRDEIAILLEWKGGDVDAVLAIVASTAPLPTPLWSRPYDGVGPFHDAFKSRSAEITKTASTADLLAKAKQRRAQLGKRVAESTSIALAAAGVP
ncbi:MAG TPA: hypothetical protein VKE69_11340, partial [Planctomycetota bacterium]|nr:hypothetical protein [Planctomycetota bacterium]